MGMMTLVMGLLAGVVPVLLIILLPRRLLLPGWGLMALAAIGFALWMMRGLIQCRNEQCVVLNPLLLGLCAGLIVATLIGGIRWLASRGKRPW